MLSAGTSVSQARIGCCAVRFRRLWHRILGERRTCLVTGSAAKGGWREAREERAGKREAGPVESLGVSVCVRTQGGNKKQGITTSFDH